jgi:hypothetical protein
MTSQQPQQNSAGSFLLLQPPLPAAQSPATQFMIHQGQQQQGQQQGHWAFIDSTCPTMSRGMSMQQQPSPVYQPQEYGQQQQAQLPLHLPSFQPSHGWHGLLPMPTFPYSQPQAVNAYQGYTETAPAGQQGFLPHPVAKGHPLPNLPPTTDATFPQPETEAPSSPSAPVAYAPPCVSD